MSKTGPTTKTRTIILPLTNIQVGANFSEEFRIDKVTIISKNKIARLRSRFGISSDRWRRISGEEFSWMAGFSEAVTCFALMRNSSDRPVAELISMIEEELDMLHLIQLPIAEESFLHVGYVDGAPQRSQSCVMILGPGETYGVHGNNYEVRFSLTLDEMLPKDSLNNFRTLMRMLKAKSLGSSWRKNLRRAMHLLGRSLTERAIDIAFLLAMTALESLLITKGENLREQLESGVYLFSGNVPRSSVESVESLFKQAYDRRCKFIHRGHSEAISLCDVRLIQEIVFNVLRNVSRLPRQFPNKNSVAEAARKLQAAKLLGVEANFWPKGMNYWRCIISKA